LNFHFRAITSADQSFLWDMLYQAIYVPEGETSPERDLIYRPELSKYVRDWGLFGDQGILALEPEQNNPVGAAWFRLLTGADKGYGYVDDATPELSIAILPEYRGKGVGSQLLSRLLEMAQAQYPSISLSVSLDNPALRLYQRLGFEDVQYCGRSLIMRKVFSRQTPM